MEDEEDTVVSGVGTVAVVVVVGCCIAYTIAAVEVGRGRLLPLLLLQLAAALEDALGVTEEAVDVATDASNELPVERLCICSWMMFWRFWATAMKHESQ